MKKIFFGVFLTILLGGFLILPKITSGEIKPEEIIDNPEKIELREKDAEKILWSLVQKIKNEWINISATPDLGIEEQAILAITTETIKIKLANFLFIEIPKEIGKNILKATIKVARLIITEDISGALDEIEKITVEKAKKYIMEWLLQKEIRVNSGNLSVSYPTYGNQWENYIFPYIIIYKPLDIKTGEVGIRIYSSKNIKTPLPKWGFQWEGGIEELPPFIVEIKGMVEKKEESYTWIRGPEINLIFDEPVPEFDFEKPGFFDRLKNNFNNYLNEIKIALEKAKEKIGDFVGGAAEVGDVIQETVESVLDKIKSVISDLNIFRATVAPPEDLGIDLSEINFENLIPEEVAPVVEEIKEAEEELKEVVEEMEIPLSRELTLEEIQEIIDDIAEKVDVISQKTSELLAQYQQTTGGPPEEEYLEELEEEEEEAEEATEEEEAKGEEIGQKFCEIMTGTVAMRNKVIFNEIAWMGTAESYNNEWIELKNIFSASVSLTGWQILNKSQKIKIIFTEEETIRANDFYLLERSSDETIHDLKADKIYTGSLNNEDEGLYLFDENCNLQDEVLAIPDWPAGDNFSKRTMERKRDFAWQASFNPGGTPKTENSIGYILISGGRGGPTQIISYPKILITEIQIAGEGEEKDEFVELYNPNENDVNLTDWYLQRKTKNAENFSTFVPSDLLTDKLIKTKDYFLIARENSTFVNIADVVTTHPLTENNTLVLKNPNRETVDKVGWGEAQDFETAPTENPPDGRSMAREWASETQKYQDSNNNSIDFEIREPTPKTVNLQPVPPTPQPESQIDITPPQVVFNLEPIQTSLSFAISFQITDAAEDPVTPSGLDGFVFRWKEGEKIWQEEPYQQIEGAPTDYFGQKEFTGKDEKTYYFQIEAKDIAGNESDWLPEPPIFTKISISKIVLINEIQIDSKEGKGGIDDDWVELYNPNDFDISLKGWSIQKHSPDEPCSIDKSFYKKIPPEEAIIPAKNFFLIVDTKAQDWLKSLADMIIGWSLTDNNTIYLVKKEDKIEGDQDLDIVDKVGFGQSCYPENASALNPPEGKSIERKELGVDTNDNSQDFKINDNPTPTNSQGQTFSSPSFGESPWPMFQHDSRHTGSSPFNGPGSSENPQVEILIEGERGDGFDSPVIGSDGTIYFATTLNGQSGIYAFYPNGRQKWFYPSTGDIYQPILTPNGDIYFCHSVERYQNYSLIMLSSDGTTRWEKPFVGVYPLGYPAVDSNGTIYFLASSSAGDAGQLIALNSATGDISWEYPIEGHLSGGSLAVGQENTVYFGQNDLLYAINSDGIEKWKRKFIPDCQYFQCSPQVATPSIAEDGTIYVAVVGERDFRAMTDEGLYTCLHAFDPLNPEQEKWPPICGKDIPPVPPTISPSGNIYFAGGYAPAGFWITVLFGFDSQGNNLPSWPINLGQSGVGGLLISDNEEIIYGLFGNTVKAFDAQGNQKFSIDVVNVAEEERGGFLSLSGDGTLFIPGRKKLYIIKP